METHQQEPEETEDDGGLDRSKLDFDPADNYFTGSVVNGTSEIPGPHAFPQENDQSGDEQAADEQAADEQGTDDQ